VRGKIHPEMVLQNCHWGFINFLYVSYHTIFSSFNFGFFVLLSSAAGLLAPTLARGQIETILRP